MLNQRDIATLVGIAPRHDDSGKRSATRCNPVIKVFYQRLLARGKAQKVALTAAMRKLLIILNAMVKTQTRWNGNFKTCA